MDINTINQYFIDYGVLAIFIIVLLEYLNLPGFPAGIIMPLAGFWAAKGEISFFIAMLITTAAGILGSWLLYFGGYIGGQVVLYRFMEKHPKQRRKVEKGMYYIDKKGAFGIFICKLLPMIRTLISIPAGVLNMNFFNYTLGSLAGIVIWNFVFVGSGYVFGEKLLKIFGGVL